MFRSEQPSALTWEVKTFLKHEKSPTKRSRIIILKEFCNCVLEVNALQKY